MFKKISISIIILLILTGFIYAIPNMINYRGKLFENGSPVTGTRNIEFRIYDNPAGPTLVWSSSGYIPLNINNGYYHYTFTGLTPSDFTNTALYLEIEIQAAGGPMTPRERLVTVPYAFNASMLDGLSSSDLSVWEKFGNNIYYTNGFVGIGTNNPLYALSVKGSAEVKGTVRGQYFVPTVNGIAGAPSIVWDGDIDTGFYHPAAAHLLAITTGGIERVRIDDSGRVGIGETAMNSLLHIDENNGLDILRIQRNGGTKLFMNNSGKLAIGGFFTPTNACAISGNMSIGAAYDAIVAPVNGLIIEGNVGIGDSTPAGRLQVVGDEVRIGVGGTINYATGDGELYVQNDLEVDGTIYGNVSGTIDSGFTAGSVIFESGTGLAQDNANFFWDNGNNRLGIGINSPNVPLHIKCAAGTNGIRLEENGAGTESWSIGVDPSGNLQFIDSGISRIMFEDNGQVGIGRMSPVRQLECALSGGGQLGLTRADTVIVNAEILGTIYFQGDAGAASAIGGMIRGVAAAAWSGSDYPTEIQFHTAPDGGTTLQRMVIDENGNVGIGTNNPNRAMEIRNGWPYVRYADTDGGNYWEAGARGDENRFLIAELVAGAPMPRFGIYEGGSVIIGTTLAVPTGLLDVRGSAVFNEDGANADFRIEGDTNPNLFFVDASANRIGIGTLTPNQQLEITGNFRMPVTTATVGIIYFGTDPFFHNFDGNISIGIRAGNLTSSGAVANIAIGDDALSTLTGGDYNTAIGTFALHALDTGLRNIALGRRAGELITVGNYNVCLGYQAGRSAGSGNVFVGYQAGYSEVGSDKLYIDNSNIATPLIWGDFALNYVNITGRLGINDSTPSYPLDVAGEASFDGALRARDATGIGFRDDGGNLGLWVEDGGQVGIGTLSPAQKLDIDGGNLNLDSNYKLMWNNNSGLYIKAEDLATDYMSFGIAGVERMRLNSHGLAVGTSPVSTYKFYVQANIASGYAGYFFNDGNVDDRWGIGIQCGTDAGASSSRLIGFHDGNGTLIGNITFTGVTVHYNAFTGSHYGEIKKNQKFEIGDVLIQTGKNKAINESKEHIGEPVYGVKKSYSEKDKRVIGVYGGKVDISGAQGSKKIEQSILINAVGNCIVKVTDSNSNIEVGDYITTSSRKGIAQKQDEAMLMNYTLGKAQESVNWKKVNKDPKKGYKWKYIPIALTSG